MGECKNLYIVRVEFFNGDGDTSFITADNIKDAEKKSDKHIEKYWSKKAIDNIKSKKIAITNSTFVVESL